MVCGCVEVVGAQRSKEGKTRIRSPRVGEAVRLRVGLILGWSVVRRCGVGCEEVAWLWGPRRQRGNEMFCVMRT